MRRAFDATARLALLMCLIGLASWVAPPLAADDPPGGEQGYFGFTPKISPGGVRISSVTPESPAEAAGLLEGDVLLLLDGESIATDSQRALIESFTRFEVGETVEVTFRRAENIRAVQVTLVPVPPPAREAQQRLAEIERRAEEFERFDRFLASIDRMEISLSKSDTLRFRATGEDEWRELPDAVAETLAPLMRRLLMKSDEPILTLRVERTDTGALSLVPDPS